MTSMRRILFTFFVALLVFGFSSPIGARADNGVAAGLAPGSIWLSKTSLTEGDTVTIFTPVYNSSAEKITGDAVFTSDDTTIATTHFSLGAGEAQILSAKWTAVVGAHVLKAHIENSADPDLKQAVSVSGNATEGISVSVAAAPPPPLAVQILKGSVNAVSNVATEATPIVTAAAGTLFNQTEQLRKAAVASLQAALGPSDTKPQGSVLGAETYRAPPSGLLASAASAPASTGIMRIIQQVLLFIVSYTWIFYPLLLISILGVLYLGGKHLARRGRAARMVS